jgi:hypothetical protein
MSVREPLSYTEVEIKGVLPSGWSLLAESPGTWDAGKETWTARVLDNVDFDWPVAVKAAEAARLGRIEALKRAMDKVYRERLG